MTATEKVLAILISIFVGMMGGFFPTWAVVIAVFNRFSIPGDHWRDAGVGLFAGLVLSLLTYIAIVLTVRAGAEEE